MSLAPIALFVYNRPAHTQRTLTALVANELASLSHLYIFSDAPKDNSAREQVILVKEILEKISGFKNVSIIHRHSNFGLARNIIDGVTEVVNKHGSIIVLEDDIVTSPGFLKYMNKALLLYANESKVWHISGYTPPVNELGEALHFFIRPTSCWGWGTWKDRWSHFKKDPRFFLKKFDKDRIYDFNLRGSYDYYSHIIMNLENKINTWAIFWYATVYFNNGLSLHPYKSFVNNIGHDESGMHCSASNLYEVKLTDDYIEYFPDKIELSRKAENAFIAHNKLLKQNLIKRIVRRMRILFGNKK